MSKIEIKKISITKLEVDAIVNAANEGLRAGGAFVAPYSAKLAFKS